MEDEYVFKNYNTSPSKAFCEDQISRADVSSQGAFHSTKISGNSGSKSNGTDIFRKFVSKISVHLSRFSFFLEIWKFPVPFVISTPYESAPVPLVVKSYKMAVSLSSRHFTGCKMICHSSSLFLIAPRKR